MQTLSKQRREELRTILLFFLIPLMLLFLLMLVAGVYMFALDVRTKSLFELLIALIVLGQALVSLVFLKKALTYTCIPDARTRLVTW